MTRLKHKRGRKSNYVRSLNSDYDKEVRRQIIVRDRSCRMPINGNICGSKLYLEKHHLTYYKNGQNILGKELENMGCLMLLCSKHHQQVHSEKKHPFNPANYNK